MREEVLAEKKDVPRKVRHTGKRRTERGIPKKNYKKRGSVLPNGGGRAL